MSAPDPSVTSDGDATGHRPRDVADAMYRNDRASQSLGMEIVEVSEERTVVRMVVTDEMVNGLDICHGGLIFSLADSAMAFASNPSNQYAVATNAEIDWISPGRVGSTLTATAVTKHHRGRNTVIDVTVSDEADQTIALFRGRTRRIDGRHL